MDHMQVTEERQRPRPRGYPHRRHHLPLHCLLRQPEGSTLLESATRLLADDGRMSSQSALALHTSRSVAPLGWRPCRSVDAGCTVSRLHLGLGPPAQLAPSTAGSSSRPADWEGELNSEYIYR